MSISKVGWGQKMIWRSQRTRDNATQMQAQNIHNETNNYYGPSLPEVERLCKDLVKAEFDRYSLEARETIDARVQEFSENFLFEMNARDSARLETLKEPFMQRALRSAEIEFATTGNIDLGAVLVDILFELAGKNERDIESISLTEAIYVAPKLTSQQLDVLTVLLLIKYLTFNYPSVGKMYEGLRANLRPFVSNLPKGALDFRHMQAVGVGWMGLTKRDPVQILNEKYLGLFTRGFELDELDESFPGRDGFLVKALRDQSKWQMPMISPEFIKDMIPPESPLYAYRDAIEKSMKLHQLPIEEIRSEVASDVPEFLNVIDAWDASEIGEFELTSVGIMIASAHFRSRVPGPRITLL
ncbi:LPO_1073/Vpar_1526 family protein [Nocardia aobensis]|uniref:LPO_1073/Vpar_1526 family protein n=1 Tax=Nocardia aobensis TaxID=257277 RepID=A0ABW6PCG1_9NOCA